MRLIDRYVLPPGCCLSCRSSQREGETWVLDLDLHITDGPYETARAYLCPQCCLEIATMSGCATPAMRDRFVEERNAAIRQATDLMTENEQLKAALTAVDAWRPVAPVELAATPKYACEICLEAGVAPADADKQNPQGLGRHMQAKHGTRTRTVHKGADALETPEHQETPA